MSRTIFRFAYLGTVLLGAAIALGTGDDSRNGMAEAGEKKKPSAEAQEAAKLLKDNLAKFGLVIHGHLVKADPSTFRLVTNKELVKEAPKVTIVISQDQARAVIDGLVSVGQFDKPRFVPPPGILPPGWYLYVSIQEAKPKIYQWGLGGPNHDLSADPVVSQLLKILEGDSKKALERLVGYKAAKPR